MGYNFVVYKKIPIMTLNGPKRSVIGFCRFISRARFGSGVMGVGLIGVLELMRIELQSSNT